MSEIEKLAARVELSALAVILDGQTRIEIRPESMRFESIPEAINAFAEWADGGFRPATVTPTEVTVTLRSRIEDTTKEPRI